MKKSKTFKRSVVFFLLVLLLLMSVACGENTNTTSTTGEDTAEEKTVKDADAATKAPEETTGEKEETSSGEKEMVVLTFLSPETGSSEWNNLFEAPVQQELFKQTGIKVDVTECDETKLQVILSSGDLPDMVRVESSYHNQLIQGGNVIPLDDLIEERGQNLKENASLMLEFSKKQWSNGTDQIYFIAPNVNEKGGGGAIFNLGMGVNIRWDYYKEIGTPEIKSPDDVLEMLAKMQALHPQTDDGKNVYGVSAWTDWLNWQYVYPLGGYLGYRSMGASQIAAYHMAENTPSNMLVEEDSIYWKSVEYYYKANQMGILDPDSLTQKFDDYLAKATAGQLLSIPSDWAGGSFNAENAQDAKGFQVIPLDWGFSFSGSPKSIGWSDRSYSISKNCKNPEIAMDLMNYMYSVDGALNMVNGTEGQQWDFVNGKPRLNEDTAKIKAAGGDTYKNTTGVISFNFALNGLGGREEKYGGLIDLSSDPEIFALQNNPLTLDFSEHYGIEYPGQIFQEMLDTGKNSNCDTQWNIEESILAAPPDDLARTEAKLLDMQLKAAVECILAESDNDFAAAKAKAIADFTDTGVNDVYAFYEKAWNSAHEFVVSLEG